MLEIGIRSVADVREGPTLTGHVGESCDDILALPSTFADHHERRPAAFRPGLIEGIEHKNVILTGFYGAHHQERSGAVWEDCGKGRRRGRLNRSELRSERKDANGAESTSESAMRREFSECVGSGVRNADECICHRDHGREPALELRAKKRSEELRVADGQQVIDDRHDLRPFGPGAGDGLLPAWHHPCGVGKEEHVARMKLNRRSIRCGAGGG